MSAPQIPNLNSLRRGGLRGRGRGGAPGIGAEGLPRGGRQANQDEIIRNTDNDAVTSRLSAVEAGYLEDPFAKLLSGNGDVARRLPLMNRGTYVRTTAIDRVVDTFLASKPRQRKQIISLGAGSDTRYFRLRQRNPNLDLLYHELDFDANTRIKIARLQSPVLASTVKALCGVDLLSPDFVAADQGSRLTSASYLIHPQDLRQLAKGRPALTGVDTTLPTLLISECCLIYLAPDHADAVLQYFVSLFNPSIPLAIAIYEPIRPNDAFGRTMISNLTARGIQLQTLQKYADLREQKQRLEQNGFKTGEGAGSEAVDIDGIWRSWIGNQEKERVDGLEWMDEVEEFVLLARHYCIAWGWRGFEDDSDWKALSTSK